MRRLLPILLLTLAMLLGSSGVSRSCSSLGYLHTRLSDYLETNQKTNIDNIFKKNELTGYLNIYTGSTDGCTCWDRTGENCSAPKVFLHENGSMILLDNSFYDSNLIVKKFYSKFCKSEAFLQNHEGFATLTYNPSFDENKVKQFSRRCKVKLTGEFKRRTLISLRDHIRYFKYFDTKKLN